MRGRGGSLRLDFLLFRLQITEQPVERLLIGVVVFPTGEVPDVARPAHVRPLADQTRKGSQLAAGLWNYRQTFGRPAR